jgi:hypothetical protein
VVIALSGTAVLSISRFAPPLFGYLFASITAVDAAVDAAVQPDATYAVRAGRNIGVLPEQK